jgi:hypothetical protein
VRLGRKDFAARQAVKGSKARKVRGLLGHKGLLA